MATLVALAHGSRDPRSAATVSSLVDVVRALRPGLDVRLAFLDLSAPRLSDVLSSVDGEAVVVPLLLGRAYHARIDVPAAVHEARARSPRLRVHLADVLGDDPRLAGVALHRLSASGVALDDPSLGVVLGAAGSSDAVANATVAAVADGWARRAPWAGAWVAFAAASPGVAEAVASLRSRGATRIAVASWFLAPGVLADRLTAAARAAAPAAVLADPLGPHPDVAQVVLDHFDAALPAGSAHPAGSTGQDRHTPAYAAL